MKTLCVNVVCCECGGNFDLEDGRFCFMKRKMKFKSIVDLFQKIKPDQHLGGKPDKETQGTMPFNV